MGNGRRGLDRTCVRESSAVDGRTQGAPNAPGYTGRPRACGGIGRRARLRALWTDWSVEVRVLSGALGKAPLGGAFWNSERRCMRQVAAAERARSANRSPVWLWVPSESFRWMTGPRSARSAGLLVGSTPSMVVKVQSAGQTLSRLLANWRCQRLRRLLRAGVLEQLPQLGLDRGDLGLEPVAVVVLVLVGAPGGEHLAW